MCMCACMNDYHIAVELEPLAQFESVCVCMNDYHIAASMKTLAPFESVHLFFFIVRIYEFMCVFMTCVCMVVCVSNHYVCM